MSRARDLADYVSTGVTSDELNLLDGSDTGPLSHRNLIINGNFRINQRGATSRTQTSSAYNYDRWYYDGTYLYQGVEDKNVRNGTFTLSWTDSGSDISAHYVISTDSSNNNGPNSGLTYTSVSNGGQITVNETTEYSKHLWIRFGGTVANLSKVQLEEGSVATPFEHRSYGDELARCQRYCQVYYDDDGITNLYAAKIGTVSLYTIFSNLPTEMRSVPTNTMNGSTVGTLSGTRHTKQTYCFLFNALSGGYAYIHNNTTPYKLFTLDAEL